MKVIRITIAAAIIGAVLAGCGNTRPKTPELSSDVVARVDAGDCLDLDDNLERAREAGGTWGEQYEALLLWKGRELGCDWA